MNADIDVVGALGDTLAAAFAHDWVAPLGRALLASLWQGAAIGIVAWLALAALRDARAQTRYAVACIALLACLLAPLSALWRDTPSSAVREPTMESAVAAAPLDAFDAPTTRMLSLPMALARKASSIEIGLPWIVAAWSIGVTCMLLRLCAGALWVRRLRRRATAAIDPTLLRRFEALRARMGVAATVRLRAWTVDAAEALIGPLAAGILSPVVILPAALIARMPAEWLEALIAHELAHIRRRDYLVNLLQTLVETLLFYHPAVWWLSRRIRHERECVADALAARAIEAPRTLALALAELDRLRAEDERALRTDGAPTAFPLTLSLAAHGGSLMSRIQHLVASKHPKRNAGLALPSIGAIASLIAIGVACLAYAQSEPAPRTAQAAMPAGAGSSAGNIASAGVAARDGLPRAEQATRTQGVTGMILAGDLFADAEPSESTRAKHEGYALVRHSERGFSISGELEHIDRIRAAKSRIDQDFVWFMQDGKPYVVRDPATLARVRAIWAESEDSERRLEAMSREMQAKSVELEALAEGMSAQAVENERIQAHIESRVAEIRRTIAQEKWRQDQAELAKLNAQIAKREAARNGGASDAATEREVEALRARSEAVEARLSSMEAEIEAKSAALEAEMANEMKPVERDIEARMEAAAAPMEALGEKMDALGKEHERIMTKVDREVRLELERAMRENLAEPAPQGDAKR
ncbi:MAG: hypothetical protein E6Q50_08745 [Lysobacter sp.]|nr:MAG: hypothetical protein E6Q50_08745 [Lysobacter sp.]